MWQPRADRDARPGRLQVWLLPEAACQHPMVFSFPSRPLGITQLPLFHLLVLVPTFKPALLLSGSYSNIHSPKQSAMSWGTHSGGSASSGLTGSLPAARDDSFLPRPPSPHLQPASSSSPRSPQCLPIFMSLLAMALLSPCRVITTQRAFISEFSLSQPAAFSFFFLLRCLFWLYPKQYCLKS